MFLPLGLLVIAWRGRWWHGILGGLLLSAGIKIQNRMKRQYMEGRRRL